MNGRRITLLVAALALLAAPEAARADSRTVSGTILVPAVATNYAGTGSDPARCAWLTYGEDSQGILGYMIPIEANERDGAHRFVLRSPATLATFHVGFFRSLGRCPGSVEPMRRHTGSEVIRGRVPRRASHALVLLSTHVGSWDPCYAGIPLCFTPTHVSQPAAGFTFTIRAS